MYHQILSFVAAVLLTLTCSRLFLVFWQWHRVRNAGHCHRLFVGGLRIDLLVTAMTTAVPLLLAPWFNSNVVAQGLTAWWLTACWLLILLPEASTPAFIQEYDIRPNRLYVDYLKYPREVAGMLWKGYRLEVVGALLALALLGWLGWGWFAAPVAAQPEFGVLASMGLSLLAAAVCFLAIRGTLAHRPINPSTVAFCGDSMVNSLPLNSVYSVAYAIYSMKNERSAADAYGSMDDDDVHHEVLRAAGLDSGRIGTAIPSLHFQQASRQWDRPLNVVLIVEESLGARYVGNLGGANLTPHLDELAAIGWNFTRAYATGTRSVRGLEAVTAGFPPTLSDASLRLSGAQQRFFTLAQLLGPLGYRSRFIYGGEAHFDNMKSFFMGNGFDELHDRPTFQSPAFAGTWGVSDEDMFGRLHELLSMRPDYPTCTLAFSVSNHTPWEYPAGRIPVDGDPATPENTIRYADWALGQFFARARQSAYWEDTVFLVVADHDSKVGGASLVPVSRFHIPALILGGSIAPRQDDRLVSQIDLPPTLLSLMGVSAWHPMPGHDLTVSSGDRALMQYGDNYGYLKGDILTVLEPGGRNGQYHYSRPERYTPCEPQPALLREALAHALWPTLVYRGRNYTLEHLRVDDPARLPAAAGCRLA